MSDKIRAQNAPKPVGLYPHARKVGNLLFLSGVGPRVAGSNANDSAVPGLELDHNGNFKSFDFEVGYNLNIPSELEYETNLTNTNYFNFGISYLIEL